MSEGIRESVESTQGPDPHQPRAAPRGLTEGERRDHQMGPPPWIARAEGAGCAVGSGVRAQAVRVCRVALGETWPPQGRVAGTALCPPTTLGHVPVRAAGCVFA